MEAPKVFTADKAVLKIGGNTALATGVQVSFTRTVQNIPLLSGKRAMSAGTPQGTMSASVLVADKQTLAAMHINEACTLSDITLRMSDGTCNGNGGGTYDIKLHNCIASAVSITLQADQGMVVAGLQVTFTAMDM